jgi:anti-sigma-K factor RskA
MEANALHDLTAAYALDALDPDEAREYEAHLARCEMCRAQLAELSEGATALAYGVEAPAPPPELRARVLDQAAQARTNVVPLRRKWQTPLAAAAAIAACAAVGLGLWASSLSNQLDRRQAALDRQELVARILAQPGSRAIPFDGGALVVARSGDAALVLRRLKEAGAGFTYEAWVADGGAPRPAGLFDGGELVAVPLEEPVRAGTLVLVTKEKAGGVPAPTRAPFLRVQNAA